jgi:hypothetical protein
LVLGCSFLVIGPVAAQTILDFADPFRSDGPMNSQRFGLRVASLLFALLALGYLLRLLSQAQVIVGGLTVPLWISAPLAVVAALLSFWWWKLSQSAGVH